MRGKRILGVILTMCFSLGLWASGTAIYEQSSKASAQAGAVVARADDATAVFYNPAGIVFLSGQQFVFNTTYISTDIKYESPTLGNFKNQASNFFLPAFYYTTPVTERMAFGVSFTAPYNLSTDWTDAFPGRFVSRHAEIVTYNLRPVLAFKLNDQNSISLGMDWYDSSVVLTRSLNTSALSTAVNPHTLPSPPYPPGIPLYSYSEGSIDTHVRDQAIGWNVGYQYRSDPFRFGLFYHSSANFTYKGHASFETSPKLGPLAAYMPGQEVHLSLTSVPAEARAGFAYLADNWQLEFDATWTGWDSWDKTMVHFEKQTPAVQDEEMLFDWHNTMSYRLGFKYSLCDSIDLYAGMLYDEAPVPDGTRTPVLPDTDRWSLQVGTGWHNDHISLDWYAMYLDFDNGSASNALTGNAFNGLPNVVLPGVGKLYPTRYTVMPDGRYTGTAYLMGIQFGYKF